MVDTSTQDVANGIVKGLKKLQAKPTQAKNAWATGMCDFLIGKGKLKNEERSTCIENLKSSVSADPVPKTIPDPTKLAENLASRGMSSDLLRQAGQVGGSIMKEKGAELVADKLVITARTAKSVAMRKAEKGFSTAQEVIQKRKENLAKARARKQKQTISARK